MTGGRVKRLQDYIGDEPFMLTYGDGVSDVNISSVLNFHKEHKKLGTITAVRPPARFGLLDMEGDLVTAFSEKPQMGEGWINGGFMVLQPEVFDYIKDDTSVFEVEVLEKLASTNQLAAYKHDGFWQCMDTLKDKRYLDGLWKSGNAPWKH
jgi:glucose-1-phosphate cytidylyltransferase